MITGNERAIGEMELNQKRIGQRMRQAREKAGLSQRALARALGYQSPAGITHKEQGKAYPALRDLTYLSEKSGYSIDWIVTGNEAIAPDSGLAETEIEMIRQIRQLDAERRVRLALTISDMRAENAREGV